MYTATFFISIAFVALSYRFQRERIIRYFFLIVGLLIPALLAGLRDYTIGNDVLLYGNYWFEKALSYTSLQKYLQKTTEYSIGPGYAFINYLSSKISNDAHFFYFLYALLQMILLYSTLKDYNKLISIPFSLFVYYFTYYNSSLNMLRQIMAILLVLLSYQYVFNRKLINFLLVILLAISFHTSAVVGIILYPLNWVIHTDFKKIWRTIVIAGSFVMIVAYEYVLNYISGLGLLPFNRYTHYLGDEIGGGRFIRFAFWAVIACMYYYNRNRIKKIAPNYELLGYCILFSLLSSIANFYAGAWLIRVMYYFDCASVISIPLIVKASANSGESRKLRMNYIAVGSFVFVYWLITYVLRNGAATFPYKFMEF